ncbi:MAG: site-specific integrase, partial [Eubacteriales bacterium]|nr:site-specific integrase [Eubacteriales bacterium]
MSVHIDKRTGKWFSMVYYDDIYGNRKQKCKRGFKTRRQALDWESEFLKSDSGESDMRYETFVENYMNAISPHLKEDSIITKKNIFRCHILPYFGKRKLNEIEPIDVANWQREIMRKEGANGKPLSSVFLKTIHNQLSASFNFAVRFYHLPKNPAAIAGNMGKEGGREMLFWTKDEYTRFSQAIMDKPMSYYAFEMLYWTGMREGELLALTPEDFDLEAKTVKISKTYQKINGK